MLFQPRFEIILRPIFFHRDYFNRNGIDLMQVSVEEKQGMSRFEQVVEEIFEEEKVKEVKREQKRQKKRARRKEKCKYGDLASSETAEECKENKQDGLTCGLKNGVEEEGEGCKVEEACEGGENELSCVHEQCDCSDSGISNGENFEHTNDSSEKWPKKATCDDGDRSCGNESCHPKSECHEAAQSSCAGQEWDKPCSELGSGESSPRHGPYLEHECGEVQLCADLKDESSYSDRDGCNHNEQVEVCYHNGYQSEALDPDVDEGHDNLPVDEEEKKLLLSMGWNSAELCQVSV